MNDMRTPLGKVRGLGSAKEGTGHFWFRWSRHFAARRKLCGSESRSGASFHRSGDGAVRVDRRLPHASWHAGCY